MINYFYSPLPALPKGDVFGGLHDLVTFNYIFISMIFDNLCRINSLSFPSGTSIFSGNIFSYDIQPIEIRFIAAI